MERFDYVMSTYNLTPDADDPRQIHYVWSATSCRRFGTRANSTNHPVAHSDSSVLPDNEVAPLETRSNHIEQYDSRSGNYEIVYIIHNQQPWAKQSDKPCLVTYNPTSHINEQKIIGKL